MDAAKKGRLKVKTGDCVSVPGDYFGAAFKDNLKKAGFVHNRIYGRIVQVVNGNRNFSVKWDFDLQTTNYHQLDNVRYEPCDTPLQTRTEIITEEDFQGMAIDAVQESSKSAAESHALVEEEFVQPSEQIYHLYVYGDDGEPINCFIASMYFTNPGVLVHNKPLLPTQQKFLIEEVLDKNWNGYDEDVHVAGTYVAWDIADISEKGKKEEEKKEENCKNEPKKVVQKGKAERKAERKDKVKAGEGSKFRKNLQSIIAESEESDEEVQVKGGKGNGKRIKQKHESEDEEEEQEEEVITVKSKGKETKNHPKGKGKGMRRKRKRESEDEEEEEQEEEVITVKENGKGTKKKPKPTKLRKLKKVRTKVTVGKKAADKRKEKNEEKEEVTELDFEDEEEESIPATEAELKKKEEETVWKKEGWKVNPKVRDCLRTKIISDFGADLFEDDSFLDYFLMYLPSQYIKEVVIPLTNKVAKQQDSDYTDFTYDEFINILALIYMMEVIQLPERRLYWSQESEGLFPALNFGSIVSLHRFEEFLNFWQLSDDSDVNEQVLTFIDAVNEHLKEVISPGETLCIDESMIKAFHRNLAGKMKIIRKPRPIGNELKTVCDGKSMIVLHMELHQAKEDMVNHEYVAEFGATTSCCLRITDSYKGSGRTVIGDSWFGSVKSCIQLFNINGLHSIFIVKTAHKQYPRFILRDTDISRGEWVSATTEIDGVKLLAVRFLDLQEKMFISNVSTTLPGPPRKTKHHGDVARPMVAYEYLQSSASVDIHNHFRTGSRGLEDVWKTKNPIHRQVAGVLGFLFTNAFLTKRYFQKSSMKHYDFKIKLANKMSTFVEAQRRMRRLKIDVAVPVNPDAAHLPKLLKDERFQKPCWYCQHDPIKPPADPKIKTSYYCEACGIKFPICHPSTVRHCFKLHIKHGMPEKRRYKTKK